MTTLIEALRAITANQLNEVIDADLSAYETGSEDAKHIVTWLAEEYPELFQFARDCVYRYFDEPPEPADERVRLIIMSTAITLGALCRAVEARHLVGE